MLFWEPLSVPGLSAPEHSKILGRLEAELESWNGTPFIQGLEMKGLGVDCVHFICAVLDVMYRQKRSVEIPRARYDAAMRPGGNQDVISTIRHMYPAHEIIKDRRLQPGDIALTGPSGSLAAGHVVIAGPRENTFWHAQGRGVKVSGLNVLNTVYDVEIAAFRATNKRAWL